MSMNAEFVQVDEREIERLRSDPAVVEALFQNPSSPASLLGSMAVFDRVMQDRVKAQGPQMFATALSRLDPSIRKALEERMGISAESFASGKGGEQLLKVMEERRAKAAERMSAAAQPRNRMTLDKDWHGLHYLLCGSTEPDGSLLGKAILGGIELEEEEGFSGYGPARLLTPGDVKSISAELNRPDTVAEASARFDAAKMNALGIYPGFRTSDSAGLLESLHKLRDFFADAAQNGKAIVACLV